MHDSFRSTRNACHLLGVVLLVLASIPSFAETSQGLRQRNYQQDRQVCLSGQSSQSQADCLREAGAAKQQHMAAQSQASAEQMAANAVQRCNTFTGDRHDSCLARMQGRGVVRGSVAGGGLLRELTETLP